MSGLELSTKVSVMTVLRFDLRRYPILIFAWLLALSLQICANHGPGWLVSEVLYRYLSYIAFT